MTIHDLNNEDLSPELAAIGAALDELAAAERRAAGPCVEDRLFMGTRASLRAGTPAELRDAEGALDALAQSERAAAGTTLEDRIFIASRGVLLRGMPRIHVRARRLVFARALRVAASFLIAGGAFFGYLVLRQDTGGTAGDSSGNGTTTLALENQIDAGMRDLSTAMQVAFSGTDAEKSATDTADKSDHDWFDEFLDKEGAL
jgi:hypothetical protein